MTKQGEVIEQARKVVVDIQTAEILQDAVSQQKEATLAESQDLRNELVGILAIKTPEQYQRVAQVRATLKSALDFFEERERPNIQRWFQGHKQAIAALAADQKIAKQGYEHAGRLLSDFDRRAEEEKRRLEREAERKRQEEEEEQIRLATLATELGSEDLSHEILEKAAEQTVSPGPVIKKDVPEVEGLHYRHGGWGFKITDSQQIADEFWMLDTQKVQQVVSRLGKQAERIVGGIEVYEKPRIPIQRKMGG